MMQHGTSATAMLTDEQILEIEPANESGSAGARSAAASDRGERSDAAILAGEPDVDWASGEGADADGDARKHGDDETATDHARAAGSEKDGDQAEAAASGNERADEPAWIAALKDQPDAAAEARRWHAAAKDVAAIDAAYFSSDVEARAGLATRLYDSDPAAFRAMLAESARTLAARDPQGMAELARQLGAHEVAQGTGKSVSQAARVRETASAQQGIERASDSNTREAANANKTGERVFPAETYRAFETTTNEDVGRQVHEVIERSLRSTLPDGIAAGARRRIGEDIFREVHASLAGDRELARRVGETLRDWRFDSAARQQVVGMVAGRAKAMLPEVTRRVVAEWTSSVLASDRAKTARIDAAASRRDITGGRLPEAISGGAKARDVDYGRMSDEQILEL